MNAKNWAWAILMTLAVFVVYGTALEVMKRRGFDPVGALATMLSPGATTLAEELP
ncbi:MAG: hypothetical protein IIA54_00510 [Chloroflexi bacterium]|nr:hypothetical protein [Chloroflexota bacterium]